MKLISRLVVQGDGGSRGNPGQAAYGFAIFDNEKNVLFKEGKRLGVTTNNVAEYSAVVNALKWIEKNMSTVAEIEFYLDSLLVASQMSGLYKVKHPDMKKLYLEAKNIENNLAAKVSYFQVPRAQNKIADKLVNDALDFLI